MKGKFVLHHTKQRKKDTVYVYYMIAWYYRKDGKPFRDVIKHLGRLTENEIEHYKNSVACLNNENYVFPCNIKKISVQNSKDFLSCSVGEHFWDHWDLSSVFKANSNKKSASTADIAKIPTLLRFFQPCSKSLTTELYNDTCLPEITKVSQSLYNKARIFRELEIIESYKDELGSHIFNFAKKLLD